MFVPLLCLLAGFRPGAAEVTGHPLQVYGITTAHRPAGLLQRHGERGKDLHEQDPLATGYQYRAARQTEAAQGNPHGFSGLTAPGYQISRVNVGAPAPASHLRTDGPDHHGFRRKLLYPKHGFW